MYKYYVLSLYVTYNKRGVSQKLVKTTNVFRMFTAIHILSGNHNRLDTVSFFLLSDSKPRTHVIKNTFLLPTHGPKKRETTTPSYVYKETTVKAWWLSG